jgi:hypothetical protein
LSRLKARERVGLWHLARHGANHDDLGRHHAPIAIFSARARSATQHRRYLPAIRNIAKAGILNQVISPSLHSRSGTAKAAAPRVREFVLANDKNKDTPTIAGGLM